MGKDADRDREDRRLFRRLKIVFRGRSPDWPVHHLKTFQKILALGSTQYSTYCNDEDGSKFWRSETKARAQHLVDTVSRLTRNQSSEIQWRLDIEKIVYKRFELEIKCPDPTCGNRLWRSEFEAEPEISNEITRSLQKRRDDRAACSCPAEARLKNQGSVGLNRIFDYRADEFIVHGGEAHYDLRPRKPDRVYGLQQTKFFTQALQAITATIQDRVTEEVEVDEIFKAFQFTPFEERARPLIFPFLISEAKTERGDSFDACERQTAFPIWTLLRMQEVLQVMSKQRLTEQGGSLVWFFANRGEEWRLYGCFTDLKEDGKDQQTSYNILDLWTGRLDSPDGALQILLLVDYIFDWARDLYRHGVARLLKLLTKKASGGEVNETVSISLDTDFSSVVRGAAAWRDQMVLDPPSSQGVGAWQNQMELDPPPPQSAEVVATPDLCQEKSEEWQKTDTVAGVFRDPSIIETCFECVKFTNGVFQTLLAPFITSGVPEERLAKFTSAIEQGGLKDHPVLISDDVLSYLEEQWTGNRRLIDEAPPVSLARYAFLVYYIHISKRWQPRRVIACIVFDDDLIINMRVHGGDHPPKTTEMQRSKGKNASASVKRRTNKPKNSRSETQKPKEPNVEYDTLPMEVTTHDVTTLVQRLKVQSMRDNLATAIGTRSVFLDKQASGEPGFAVKQAKPFEIPAFFQVLQMITSEDPRGSLEPLTRFSGIVEYQSVRSTDSTGTLIRPYFKIPFSANSHGSIERYEQRPTSDHESDPESDLESDHESESILVYSNSIGKATKFGGPEWCLFYLNSNGEVPDIEGQFKLLINLWESDGFYVTYDLGRGRGIPHKITTHSRAGRYERLLENDADSSDYEMALSQWKAMLADIYMIKYLASLADTEPLALSKSIKRSMTGGGRNGNARQFGGGLKSWCMVRVKKELVEEFLEQNFTT